MSTDIHEPTPEFRYYLEGEVARAYRRHRSFARLRGLAIVVASLAIGATAGIGSAQIREGVQRDSLLESATAQLQLVALRQQLVRAQLADVTAKVSAGALGPEAAAAARAEVLRMDAEAMRAQLNLQEIRATARPPRDDLNAPVVNGKDFVTDRLMLDLMAAQQRLNAAEEGRQEVERRVRVGMATELAMLEAELDVTRAQASMGALAKRRDFRRDFVEHGRSVEELTRRMEEEQAKFDMMVLQHSVRVAQARMDLVQKLRATGRAAELDHLRAELELRERQLELQSTIRRMEQLRSRLKPQ